MTQSLGDGIPCLHLGWTRKGPSSFRFLPAAATTVSIPKVGWETRGNSAGFREQPLEEPSTEKHRLGLKGPPHL